MSHAELVERAARWLQGSQRCVFVVTEIGRTGECPDAIGWTPNGHSILVECKASRGDFYADRSKPWRRHPDSGIGCTRYYMTAPGLVTVEQVPEGWGLLECEPRIVRRAKQAPTLPRGDYGWRNELTLLLNAVRRCHGDPRITGSMNAIRHIEPASLTGDAHQEGTNDR